MPKRYALVESANVTRISRITMRSIELKATIQEWHMWWRTTHLRLHRIGALSQKHREMNLLRGPLWRYITQALTGHGCFQYYLHRLGRVASSHWWTHFYSNARNVIIVVSYIRDTRFGHPLTAVVGQVYSVVCEPSRWHNQEGSADTEQSYIIL